MPSIRKNWTKIILHFLIFCFIWLISITPNAYCSEDSPYCTGDDDAIQALVDDFIATYGEDAKVYWNELSGLPYIVAGMGITADMEHPEEAAFSFLSQSASLLGIDINDIAFRKIHENKSDLYIDFDQFYKGVPVHGGDLRVFIRKSDGTVISVSSHYIPCVELDVIPLITAEEAAEFVKEALGAESLVNIKTSFDLLGGGGSDMLAAQKEILPVIPELIVYAQNMGEEVYLCWHFRFTIEEPYGPNGSWYYLIDAHTGEIIKGGSPSMGAGSGSENTSENNSSNSNNSSNYQLNNFNWFPGSFLNMAQNYGSLYNNSFFPFYSNPFSSSFFNPIYNNYGEGYNNSSFLQFNNPSLYSFLDLTPSYEKSYENFFSPFSNPFSPASLLFPGLWDGGSTIYDYNYIYGQGYNSLFPGIDYFPLDTFYSFISNPFIAQFNL